MESGPARIQQLPRLWPSRAYYGWAIVFTSFFISIAQVPMYGPVFSVFVKPIEDELGWSRTTITVAFTVGSLGGAMLASVVGPIVDRYGARGVMSVTGLLVTAGLLAIAAMTEPWHFWVAYGVARTVSVAGVGLGTSVAIANWFIRKRGRAIAMRAAGQRSGQAIVPLLILPVLLTLGWRESFVVLAVVAALFITIPSLMFIRRRPEDFGLRPDGDSAPDQPHPNLPPSRGKGPGGVPAFAGTTIVAEEYSWTLRQVRATRTLWLLTLGMAAGLSAQIAINVHAVANFEDKGISQGLAVTVASIFTGVAAVSMMGWGMLVERIHVRYVSMAAMGLFFLAMGVLLVADTYPMAVLFAVLFGLGTGGWTVAQMIMIPNYFGRLHAGSIKGFISPVEGLLGISGPLVAAFVFDATGSYDAAFVAAAATFAVGCAAFYLAKPLRVPATAGAAA
ncbi:MAG: MFS transporter [Chloroflexi bacterium]|nr:MFS transporter [Chloroflexota bacterium]